MTHNWHYPTEIYLGENELHNLSKYLQALTIKKPLLVIDEFILTLDTVQHVIKSNNIKSNNIYYKFASNPTDADILAGNKQANANNNDGIICIGGGSALDTGKTIALSAKQSCALWDLEDKADNYLNADTSKILPIIAIPTTAGTGSEVGRATAIIKAATLEKKLIFHPKMLPAIVIADPNLHLSLPEKLTAATGMDALAHSLEAYCAPGLHPMADGIAVAAIKLIKQWLPTAVKDPNNIAARSNMLCASIMGATAFHKGLGAIHSLSHPVGGLYGAHHGLLNAIFMLPVLQFNRPAIEEKICYLATCLELNNPSFESFCNWLTKLCLEIGIPDNLSQAGIPGDKIDLICARAMTDSATATNPRQLSIQDFKNIFTSALKQNLEIS